MNDNETYSGDLDAEFDQWLQDANAELIDSTQQALNVNAMLASTKRHAAASRKVDRRATKSERASIGEVFGALALKVGGTPPSDETEKTPAQVLQFPKQQLQQEQPARPDGDIGPSISAAIVGEPSAVNAILTFIRPLIVKYCRARIGRKEQSFASADDVAQEVCLVVLKALPSFRDQGRPFLAFVYGIAAHKVADVHRAAARDREESMMDVPEHRDLDSGPDQRAMQGDLTRRMKELLDVLPPKQREIVVLRVVVGLSAEETAEAVGSTPGAVRVAQHRALARLRKTLAATELV
jgi:RNA polymerase sigma-70 factor, ECF subfamily